MFRFDDTQFTDDIARQCEGKQRKHLLKDNQHRFLQQSFLGESPTHTIIYPRRRKVKRQKRQFGNLRVCSSKKVPPGSCQVPSNPL